MVNSMEEFWKKDPELTFHQVKNIEDQFGRNGFKAIEKERKILQKFDKKYNGCRLFKVSKIVGSILFAFVCFQSVVLF
jgi:hypothetical protein